MDWVRKILNIAHMNRRRQYLSEALAKVDTWRHGVGVVAMRVGWEAND
jgi:hypothetical protein